MEIPLNPSESFKKLNPHLYLGKLEGAERKPDSPPALDRGSQARQGGTESLGICVTLIGIRRKLLDDDNFSAGCKALRDAVAASLGIDDGRKGLHWNYAQIRTTGPEGVIVCISTL